MDVVVGSAAPELERFAARELCDYLAKLYRIQAYPARDLSTASQAVFLIGSPETNATVKQATSRKAFPKVSDQGIVLRRAELQGRPALIVGGGSPRATLWAVYAVVERWGVRYLVDRDVLPDKVAEFQLPDLDVVMEPVFRIRAHPTMQEFASSGESWGIADFRRLIDQLAKLKFNRINIYSYGWQPFLHYELNGINRRSAWLWYDYHYPITPDMPGRELFGDAKEFWNPDLPLGASYEEFAAAGQRLIRQIIEHGKRRGMDCAISAPTLDFTPEFAPLLKGAEKSKIRTGLTVVPGEGTPVDDPQLAELASATLRATLRTYPDVDMVAVWMPEVRQWTGDYERAWKALDAKYGISKVRSLHDVLNAADQRRSWQTGDRLASDEVKADITSLYFYDRLLRDPDTLDGTPRPEVKFMYLGIAEELFPILNHIIPRGWQLGLMPENWPVLLLKRLKVLAPLPSADIPSVLDVTLDDDNLGIVPQFANQALRGLIAEMRRAGWAGFVARERFPGDHDVPLNYLARAAWDANVDPDDVARDCFRAVCGEGCVADMMEAMGEAEKATILLTNENRNFAKERPTVMTKYWAPGPVPGYLAPLKAYFERAIESARRALARSKPEGREYVKFWLGRLEFSRDYTMSVEAIHRAATAEAANNKSEALDQTRKALVALRRGLEAYARVARTQSDRGAVAMMVEFGYRFLKAKEAALSQ